MGCVYASQEKVQDFGERQAQRKISTRPNLMFHFLQSSYGLRHSVEIFVGIVGAHFFVRGVCRIIFHGILDLRNFSIFPFVPNRTLVYIGFADAKL